ncbi:uncharacterized protein LOC118439488 [Folsomia candida]|nr:uncharacterized protein LOC118439488 [Folsomia candida]
MSSNEGWEEGVAKLDLTDGIHADDEKERADLVKLLKARILRQESFFNWIPDQDTFDYVARTAYASINSKFEELRQQDDEIEERNSAFELVGNRLVVCYLGMELKKEADKIDLLLQSASDFLEKCFIARKYISIEYYDGFKYLLTILEQYWRVVCQGGVGTTLDKLKEWSNCEGADYQSLPRKGQVGVLSAKSTFLGETYRKGFDLQAELLAQMAIMDPTQAEWHLVLHYVLKFKRRNGIRGDDSPDHRETSEVLEAVKLAPSRPRVRVAYASCLAEHVRANVYQRTQVGIDFVTKTFSGAEEAVQFLRKETR